MTKLRTYTVPVLSGAFLLLMAAIIQYMKRSYAGDYGNGVGLDANNPGNIRYAGRPLQMLELSSGFARYASLSDGLTDLVKLLRENYLKQGFDTPLEIVYKYAPPISVGGDNADDVVIAYIDHISTHMDITSDTIISDTLPNVCNLVRAITTFELPPSQRWKISGADIIAAYIRASI